ncbi:MAG: hypothetical protein H6Q87_1115, partial [candidate division NC10 bacterium]|nr:hypothetical protein [candidate division NC10 bacterium]
AASSRGAEYTSLLFRGQMPGQGRPRTSAVGNEPHRPAAVMQRWRCIEQRKVSEASAVRCTKTLPWHSRPRERLDPGVRPALGPFGPGPEPDLIHARESPKIIDVPTFALLVPEVPNQTCRQVALGRSDIHVPASREATTPQSTRRHPARLTDAKDQRIDSTIVVVAKHVPLQDRFARRPPELSWRLRYRSPSRILSRSFGALCGSA